MDNHQVIRVAQLSVVGVLREHVGEIDLGSIDVLTSENDGELSTSDEGEVLEDVSELD